MREAGETVKPQGLADRCRAWCADVPRRAVNTVRAAVSLWLAFFAGALLIIGGHWWAPTGANEASFLRGALGTGLYELGFAVLVAAILFVIFEQWSARQHTKTAIGLLYGVRPEGEFFDKIEDYVLMQRFYRTELVVTYDFQKCEGEMLLVRQSASYWVRNISSRYPKAEFPLGGRVDLRPLHGPIAFGEAILGVEKVTVETFSHERELLGKKEYGRVELNPEVDEKQVQTWSLSKKPKLDRGQELRIEAVQYAVKHNHDAEVWATGFPCEGVELRVCGSEAAALEFKFSAMHPEHDTLPEKEDEANGARFVKLENVPFLKGHGIHVMWAPKTGTEDKQRPIEGEVPG
jgi:hypothetical protein